MAKKKKNTEKETVDIEIPEDAIEKRQSGKRERKPRSSKPRENNDGNKKRKRVSFEDEFEKGI